MKIKFDEASHTYTHKDTNEKFISVTTLLGKYKQPFDRDGHSKRVANREGISQELVLEMWEKEKVRACNRGTDIHKILEDYISFGDVRENYGWLCKSYDKAAERSIDSFKNVLCENLLYDEEFKIAGTADLIYEHKNEFTVGDFKTNKRFRFSSPFSERLKDPVSHLHNCEFNLYGLQLSLYAYLYERMTGKRCRKCVIYYLQDERFLAYHVNYMKAEVEAILASMQKSRAEVPVNNIEKLT